MSAKRLSRLLVVGLLFTAASGHAGTREGNTAVEQEDYAVARHEFVEPAQAGDVLAQRYLGLIELQGLAGPRRPEEGVAWLEKAAAQGDVEAGYNLGVAYYLGDGVAQDDARAFTLFEAAARQGHDGATFNLAAMYRDGRGTGRDPGAAVKWFVAAARAGQGEAFHELARIALAEEAAPENLVLAHMWLL